jgi:Xaa-Pro dipeptidase
MDITAIQAALQEQNLAGWLFYDFRKSNLIAYQVLDLPTEAMYTRRWFYFIPTQGEPVALVSAVESHVLQTLPGRKAVFRTWSEMQEHLRSLLSSGSYVAMEYSPLNAIPYVSRVDAGTIELILSLGAEVISSADLVQRFTAQLSSEQLYSHRAAGRRLISAKDNLFIQLGEDLRAGRDLDEWSVQQRFIALIRAEGIELPEDELPIVAVNANASNPHYEPTSLVHDPIRPGDLILFDFWGTLPQANAIFADYTWMAFAGTREDIPTRYTDVFEVVRNARDSAIAFMRESLAAGRTIQGFAVDDVARGVITRAGYADYFVHRTGHSIGTALHGNSANIDNYETQDERRLLPLTCNSIEPGIYLPEFGIRSEVNTLILEHDVEVTGTPIQQEISALL